MTKLYIIRHGQSLANLEKVFAGHYNIDLTELGRAQAEKAADFFLDRGIRVDAIVSSDLLRAYHTACPLAQRLGLPIEAREDIREIFAGAWEGVAFSNIEEKYKEDFDCWREDPANARCTGGESVEELAHRVLTAVTAIAEAHEGETVVLVSHGTPIRALTALWQVGDIGALQSVPWAPNASIMEVTYENGRFSLERVACTEHLGAFVTNLPANV